VFRKDVVSLIGFDAQATASIWEHPDDFTKAYWFDYLLKPHAESLRSGGHHLVAAFLQLGGDLDQEIWGQEVLVDQIRNWFSYRNKETAHQRAFPEIRIEVKPLAGKHWLVVTYLG
jgi:hypothetical protein